jgi:hypothetical protein
MREIGRGEQADRFRRWFLSFILQPLSFPPLSFLYHLISSSVLLYRISLFTSSGSTHNLWKFTFHKFMTRSHRFLSVILFTAIAAGSGSLVSTSSAQACPLRELRSGSNLDNFPQKADQADNAVGASGDSSQQNRIANNSQAESNQFSQPVGSKQAGMVGLGAIAALAVIGLIYRAGGARRLNPAGNTVLSNHPELEHPELILTSVPKEAFSSSASEELVGLR